MRSLGQGRNNKIEESFQRWNWENLVSPRDGGKGAASSACLPHLGTGHWQCGGTLNPQSQCRGRSSRKRTVISEDRTGDVTEDSV